MRVVVTGASGQLGAYLLERLVAGGHAVRAWSGGSTGTRAGLTLEPVDLAHEAIIERALDDARPDAVVHAAAISATEAVRRDPLRARAVNVLGTGCIAAWCDRRRSRLLYTSTDLVFDGSQGWRREDDPAEPVLEYGRTKLEAEPAVTAMRRGLVCRMSLLFGLSRCGRESFFDRAIAALRRGEPQAFFDDEYRTPLHLATAAEIIMMLLESDATGIVHVGGTERLSRYELMQRAAGALGLNPDLVRANRRADVPLAEPRPADVSLDTSRLVALLPNLARPSIEASLPTPPDVCRANRSPSGTPPPAQ